MNRRPPPGPSWSRRGAAWVLAVATLASGAAWLARSSPAVAQDTVVGDVRAADALAGRRPSKPRDRALGRWAKDAPLADVLYVLRRPSRDLGEAEAAMVEAALKRVPPARAALRARLATRLAAIGGGGRSADAPNALASPYRVAAILPDTGSFAGYAQAVREGLSLGLRDAGPSTTPIALERLASNADSPALMLAAFDSAAARSGAVVGELLSIPTTMLATASRYERVPLVSPTAPDEHLGEIARMVFQIGPSGYDRAAALAERVLGDGVKRVGILVPSDLASSPWVNAFDAAVGRSGARVVWRETYAPGDPNFKDEVREMRGKKLDLLFWDGDPREGEALLMQMGRDNVAVKVCGGEGLAPDHHHTPSRPMLEGVRYVSEEWVPTGPLATRLDSLSRGGGREPVLDPLRLRGYLSGYAIARAVASGALCPEEIADSLAARTLAMPRGAGFLDVRSHPIALPVYRVEKGKAIETP